MLIGVCPPLPRLLAAHRGCPLTDWGVLLHLLAVRVKRAMLGARIKRALPFRGFPLLLLYLDVHRGNALSVPFSCTHLRFFGVPYPRGLLGVVPAPQGPCGGCVDRLPLRHQ